MRHTRFSPTHLSVKSTTDTDTLHLTPPPEALVVVDSVDSADLADLAVALLELWVVEEKICKCKLLFLLKKQYSVLRKI